MASVYVGHLSGISIQHKKHCGRKTVDGSVPAEMPVHLAGQGQEIDTVTCDASDQSLNVCRQQRRRHALSGHIRYREERSLARKLHDME